MATWMIYAAVVSCALSLAALLAEHAARQRRAPRRWLWVAVMAASLLLPVAVSSVPSPPPERHQPARPTKPLALREVANVRLPPVVMDWAFTAQADPVLQVGWWLPRLWALLSAAMVAALALSAAWLHRRKRAWSQTMIEGTPVHVAPDVGPAVVGLLRPCIVVPAWLLQAPLAQQRLVLAHEQAHLDARDPQWLALAVSIAAAMPWNLPLWWQLHRLRRAIEVDCDARVLRAGKDLSAYGETLIEVGRHRSAYVGAMTGMSESRSFLEQRIKIMLQKPARWASAWALALACLSIGVVAVAAQVAPPAALPAGQQVEVPLSKLEEYVGSYEFAPIAVVTVTLKGKQLFDQFNSETAVEMIPKSQTEFFLKGLNIQVSFVRDAQGRVSALVNHQNGRRDTTALRISDAEAEQLAAGLAARIENQQPYPGSEAALRLILDDSGDGHGMSPRLIQARKDQRKIIEAMDAKLGPMTSYEYLGVARNGADQYLVRHQHGIEIVSLALDSHGIVTAALRQP